MIVPIRQFLVRSEQDIVLVRQHTKKIAHLAGLSLQDQTRFITAASEIMRNALQYAGESTVELCCYEADIKKYLKLTVRDRGPGITNLQQVLDGQYISRTGMGMGIVGARRLVDLFLIDSTPGSGTSVSLAKEIATDTTSITDAATASWAKNSDPITTADVLRELQEQNFQLMQTLQEADKYKRELEQQLAHVEQLNQDLDQTNKGILALYKELDERSSVLEQQRKQLQEATHHKSEFLANMSHEIRTPMNGVLGMTEILLSSGLTEKQLEYAATIQAAGQSLLAIINDILDFSKIEAGKLALDIVEFDPVRLTEDVAELLAPQARQKGLALLTFIDPELPSDLLGDPGRLRQILINFLGNAIKFSSHGSILVRATRESLEHETMAIKFAVTDPGIGLSDDEIERLFEPFSQADGSTTRRQGGTGLGLSICKRLVQLMGGEIGVTSIKGRGSTFWFSLQLKSCYPHPARPLVPETLTNMRALIVDDDPAACEILQAYIVSWGMRQSVAADAKAAFSQLMAAADCDPFDFVIVDLVMPDLNGMQMAKFVHDEPSLQNAKLILITAFDKPGIGPEAIQLGFDAYLTKPIKQSQLLNAMTTAVYESRPNPDRSAQTTSVTAAIPKSENVITTRKELILVAEDHPINQQVALLFLANLGFEAHIAENGHHVVETIKRIPYSLIFMDCQMPEMDGFNATREIRKLETKSGKRVPIVAMTAHAVEGSREQCLAAGMDDYISKPINPERLKALIAKWLPMTESTPAPSGQVAGQSDLSDQANSPVDILELKSIMGESGALRLLSMFSSHTAADLDRLRAAVDGHDDRKLINSAHLLKGVFATACAHGLRDLVSTLEISAQERDWDAIHRTFAELETALSRANDAIAGFLADGLDRGDKQ